MEKKMRAGDTRRLLFGVSLFGAVILMAATTVQARERFIILDIADDTQPTSINDKGVVTGVLGGAVGFIRQPDGTVAKFSVPGATFGTVPTSINNKGEVVGRYAAIREPWHGFVRRADGTIKTFELPHDGGGDFPAAVNSEGMVFGYFQHARHVDGFVRDRHGQKTIFDCPCGETYVTGANDIGAASGYGDEGFIRNPDGTFTLFNAGQNTAALSINAEGSVAGQIGNVAQQQGFLRTPDGGIIVFAVPEATNGTIPASINDDRTITGGFVDSGPMRHGFVRAADGTITTFDPPGSTATYPVSINNKGKIAGSYFDVHGHYIGFIRLP